MADKTTAEWLEYYENLEQKNYYAYQESGERRYDNAQHKYSVIVDALRAKLEKEDDRDKTIKRRMENMRYVTSNLISDRYTKAEVIEMLGKAVWW